MTNLEEGWARAAEAGVFRALLPNEFGGDASGLEAAAARLEALAHEGSSTPLHVLTVLAGQCIEQGGSDALKTELLPTIARGERKIALAVTEARAGFNTFAIEASARRDGDSYLLEGEKNYVSGADVADDVLVIVRTKSLAECRDAGMPKTFGLSAFLVDLKSDGLQIERLPVRGEGDMAPCLLTFSGTRVPEQRRLGPEDGAAMLVVGAFGVERILMASQVLGSSRLCIDKAVRHAIERKVFGDTPIGAYQAIQHPLADAQVRLEAVRAMLALSIAAVERGDNPLHVEYLVNATKYLASEMGRKAVDAAIRALGGRGFDERDGVIHLLEAMRLYELSPISDELVLNRVAEKKLGLPRSY